MKSKRILLTGILTGIICSALAGTAAYLTLHCLGNIVGAVTHDDNFETIFAQFGNVDIALPLWGLFLIFLLCGLCGMVIFSSKKTLYRILSVILCLLLTLSGYGICLYFAAVKGVPVYLIVKIVVHILNSGVI